MNRVFSTSLLGLVVIFVASFGDEVASITFAFAQVDATSMAGVSVLMSCALLGGIVAGPVSVYLLNIFKPRSILRLIFVFAGVVVILSASHIHNYVMYTASFVLGCLGSVFWSVLLVIIPESFDEESLTDVNKVVHSIRNSGYILGPVLAGLLSSKFNVYTSLIIVGLIFFIAAPFTAVLFRKKYGDPCKAIEDRKDERTNKKIITLSTIQSFFRLRRMRITLLPLIVTICTTSTFNVAFIHLLLIELHYSQATYGYIVSAISIGLVVGPIALASMVEKIGVTFGACICASIIGFCLLLVGVYQAPVWLFFVLLLLGLVNGVQNTLMATFTMKVVPKHKRNEFMPTYMFIVQSSVLAGFVIGGQVPVQYAQLLLIVSGTIASIAGVVGAASNLIADKADKCREEGKDIGIAIL